MNLKIIADSPAGRSARVFLDGVEISSYTSRVVLTVDANGAIMASIHLFPTSLDIDVPALVEALQPVTEVPMAA